MKHNGSDSLTAPNPLVLLAFSQSVRVLLQWTSDQLGLLPQVGGQEAVGIRYSNEGGLKGVLEGLGRAGG
jgi:hypothetical protein